MLSEGLVFWLGLGVCLLMVPFLLGPPLVYAMLRFRMPPHVISVDPLTHSLPEAPRKFLEQAYHDLDADGFQLRGTVLLPDLTPNAKTLFALYTNSTTLDMAMSAIIVAQAGVGPELKASYVEFVRRYHDGIVVQTNNSRELSAFKRMPGECTTKFWDIHDTRQLFQLHQKLAERFRQRGQPLNPLDNEYGGDVVGYVAKAILEVTLRDQVGTGYLAENDREFRPTLKGACLMAWQEVWPLKSLRRRREKRRAEALLEEFE